ncbi:MAG: Succinyl-diaminopimelate desuccinylase [Chlamydiia bacterium]|nr:Succinyl-diaminopimelate desuccinylase [Chlamydiia bacterium]MCH9615136.1 Succinyl-diaminopimelate desuccinylase [Chlamydiia bacterium]MCH9628542.1 Succinyl-diaminopimelate desuccinylase [Chlamydiia bacterium]
MNETLKALLSIPSVSSEKVHEKDVKAACEFLRDYLSTFMQVEIWEGDGHPILFASHLEGEDKKTLLLYGHYDVQPVDPLELWVSPPFEPTVREGHIYARGAIDNKGQLFYTLEAVKQFIENGGGYNIKFVIEGEEEIGSPFLSKILPEKKGQLKADHFIIPDVDMNTEEKPAIQVGLRGILTMEVSLKGSETDLHSGSFGGIAYNPNRALVELLAKCYDEKGQVTIPGFYEGITKVNLTDLMTDIDYEKDAHAGGVNAVGGIKGASLIETNWLKPTLEINGIWGGYTGDGFKTVIPAKAHAKISMRIPAGQDPKKLGEAVKNFLLQNVAEGVELSCELGHGSRGVVNSPTGALPKVVKAAYESVLEKPCGIIICGASIPIVEEFAKHISPSFVLMGIALNGDGMHAPNERVALKRLELGERIVLDILERFKQL